MLEQISTDAWVTPPMRVPFGRGINLQIEVPDVGKMHAGLAASGIAPFRELQTEWYREDEVEHGQTELMVQDPDGYLLRFVQVLGTRPAGGETAS